MFEEILSSLRRNKLRTALTGFSVAWGIFILIVLLGAGNGLVHSFESASGDMALNSMSIYPGWTSIEYKGLRANRRIRLTESDVREIMVKMNENIIDIIPTVSQSSVTASYGDDYVSTSLEGVYPDQIKVERAKVTNGRFINQIDINDKRKVCIIGNKTRDVLFADATPIGQFINASGVAYKVVGVYTDNNDRMTQSIYIPFSTLMTIYCKDGYIDDISMTTRGLTDIPSNEAFTNAVRSIMGERKSFDKDDKNALWIWNRMTNYLTTQTVMGILTTSIWVIGLLTLISGIVGVSNIMLITVKERTHEFGIRKALGAKPWQILSLIVTESIAITAIFGYVGMMFGIGATELINLIVQQTGTDAFSDPTVNLSICFEATLTLIVAGTLAGFFPAKRAVKIKPIEALRA